MKKERRNMMDVLESMGMIDGTQTVAPMPTVVAPVEPYLEKEVLPLAPEIASRPDDELYQAEPDVPPILFETEEDLSLPSADDFTEVEEIYRKGCLKSGGNETIYLLEEYINTLPDTAQKRELVLRLVAASGFQVDDLLNDGLARMALIDTFAAAFRNRTEDLLARYSTEAERLARCMELLGEMSEERRRLHQRQIEALADEAERLKAILSFLN